MNEPLAYWCDTHNRVASKPTPESIPQCPQSELVVSCNCVPLVKESWIHSLDMTNDSVHLLGNGERAKALIVMDVTPLRQDQQSVFINRALLALTRMAEKITQRRNQN